MGRVCGCLEGARSLPTGEVRQRAMSSWASRSLTDMIDTQG